MRAGPDRFPDPHADVVALEPREPSLEGEDGVRLAELVRWALAWPLTRRSSARPEAKKSSLC